MEQISDFKLWIKLSKIYHHQNGHLRTGNIKRFVENFDGLKHFGQSWLVLGIAILAQEVDKLCSKERPELFSPSFSIK